MRVPKASGRDLPASIRVGVLATITMDVAMVIASRVAAGAFASDKMSLEAIGRWAGGLGRGRRRQGDISAAPKLRGELALGLATHYLTGIVLTEAYFVLLRRSGLGAGPAKATAYGLATSVLPLLVLYPSMGYGCCARRSDDAASLVRLMLLGHTAFGAGIGLWAALLRGRPSAP
jgi:hypothetical protein